MLNNINISTKKFQEFLKIEQERQLAMKELSMILGYDVSFSKEEVMDNAGKAYANYISKEFTKEVSLLMKSAF